MKPRTLTPAAPAGRLIFSSFLLLGLSGPVAAQRTVDTIPVGQDAAPAEGAASSGATELDTIEVTGSRIKRTDFETAQPIFSLSRADIERTGLTSIGDLLQEITAAGSALNTTFNNGGNGSVNVDLRNLGSSRVLVLVNGRRWVNGLNAFDSSSVDLNTIPISIIERVEVLKDGASAVYGSDAIAGVVNIITRKNYQGAEIRTQVGSFFEEGDGLIQSHSLSLGSISGRTSVFVDLSYTKQNEVFAGDREISRVPTYGVPDITRGSSRSPQGRFLFVPDATNVTLPCAADGLCDLTLAKGEDGAEQGDFIDFVSGEHRYNFAPINYLLTPNERSGIFAAVSHQFTPSVAFQGEFLYNVRKSTQRLAETPVDVGDFASPPFNTLYVAADNPYNPFGQDIGRNNPGTLPALDDDYGSGVIFRRMTELGARVFRQDVDTYRVGGGLTGGLDLFDRYVEWNAGLTIAESRNQERQDGLVNIDRLRVALGPVDNCTETPGCVPFNIFGGQGPDGKGSITGEMLDYVAYIGQGSQAQRLYNYYGYVSHELFNLPAGPIKAAWGIERRQEYFSDTPDPLVQTSASSTNRALPTSGDYSANEAYVEFGIPILNDFPFVQELDVTPAVRFSDYDVFGSSTNYKIGLRYKPYADLLVRSTVSTAFRAPSISNLYLGLSDSFPAVGDPCSLYNDPSRDDEAGIETIRANCSDPDNPANGGQAVPDAYEQLNGQLLTRFGGNPNLTPEEADTYTFGIVFNPEFVPDLNIYVDWYRIELVDAIDTIGANDILDRCYSTPGGSSTCSLITRNATGNIDEIRNLFLNIGARDVEGIDFAVDYILPWFREIGTFRVLLDAAYLTEYVDYIANEAGQLDGESFQGRNLGDLAFPRWKINTTLAWSRGNWEASLLTRYMHSQVEDCDDGLSPSLASLGLCSDPKATGGAKNELEATFYNDVQVSYVLPGFDVRITGGIKNLLDQDPPVSYSAFANSFDATQYEVPGRFPYLRLGKSF